MSNAWLKFYPSDWRSDPALRMCSIAARGLWMEMLCVMHEATPRGSLLVNGAAVSDRQLAGLAGVSLREVSALIGQLEAAGVFSRDNGTIYSRRMRKDTEKAERDKANGKGGGNPKLKGGVNPEDKAQSPEARDQKQEPPPSASPVAVDELDEAFAAYNSAAAIVGWPEAQALTKLRKSKLRQRIKDAGGLPGWRLAMERATRSKFLCGDSKDGWKADLDFFLQASSFTKLMEGSYDDRTGRPGNGKPAPIDPLLRAVAEQFAPRDGVGRGQADADGGLFDHQGDAPGDRAETLDLGETDYRRR